MMRPSNGDFHTIREIMMMNRLPTYLALIVNGAGPMASLKTFLFRNSFSCDEVPCKTEHTRFADFSISDESFPAIDRPSQESLKSGDSELDRQKNSPHSQKSMTQEPEDNTKGLRDNQKRTHFISRFTRRFSSRDNGGALDERTSYSNVSHRWYDDPSLKTKLLLEKETMRNHFPDFSLHVKDGHLFWKSDYRGHRVLLRYPQSFPHEPIQVFIVPDIVHAQDENPSYYAVIAAEYAIVRIDRKALEEQEHTSAESAEPVASGNERHESWEREERLAKEMADLTHAGYDSRQIPTAFGAVTFQVFLKNSSTSVVLTCSHNYPDEPPSIQVRSEHITSGTREAIENACQQSTHPWNPRTDSLLSIVQMVASKLLCHDEGDYL